MTERNESELNAPGGGARGGANGTAPRGTGAGDAGEGGRADRFDLSSLFPAKGDARRPPDWFGRALLYVGIGVFAWLFVRDAWKSIDWIVLDIVISVFLALAMEPVVLVMVRHGWRRGVASCITMVGLAVILVGLFTMFGSMLVQQLIGLIYSIPSTYNDLAGFVAARTPWRMPSFDDLGSQLYEQLINGNLLQNFQLSGSSTGKITDLATQMLSSTATSIGAFLGSFFLQLMTVVLVTYYVSAAGASMRRAMCKWIRPEGQRRFLVVWTVVQEQISSFLFSRIILALINATCLSVFMLALSIPNWLPLSIFCGIVSQFIPTIGTYIGGALPVLFALGSNGVWAAVAVLVYIIVYQQIENMILSPIISKRTMDINPAISLLAVFVGGAVFGALGAFLALPVAASIQVIFTMNTRQYELIDSPLLDDPKVTRKSKLVEASEAINATLIKPVSDHLPRAARGTTSRVSTYGSMDMDRIEEELAELYNDNPSHDGGEEGADGAPLLHKPLFAATARAHRGGEGKDAGSASGDGGEPRRRHRDRKPRPTASELDVSETIAIPKGVLGKGGASTGGASAGDADAGSTAEGRTKDGRASGDRTSRKDRADDDRAAKGPTKGERASRKGRADDDRGADGRDSGGHAAKDHATRDSHHGDADAGASKDVSQDDRMSKNRASQGRADDDRASQGRAKGDDRADDNHAKSREAGAGTAGDGRAQSDGRAAGGHDAAAGKGNPPEKEND